MNRCLQKLGSGLSGCGLPAALLLVFLPASSTAATVENSKAREVAQAAIQAMGGERYLAVKTVYSAGRYFGFRNERKSFARFQDWTDYQPPVKSRFQLGKGKRRTVWIFNMELEKGWKQEGEYDVAEVTEEEIKDFLRRAKRDIDYLLRHRLDEEGLQMFYYGPDEISGSGILEAVEFIDSSNDSIVVYFNRDTRLPHKTETHFLDRLGIRRKQEFELENWHDIDGVKIPFNYYGYVDGEKTQERFLEEVTVNPPLTSDIFLEPVVKERKKKKK